MSLRSYVEDHSLQFIAAFKLLKGLALFATGLGALHLLHRDVSLEVYRWVDAFRVDPGNRFIHSSLVHLASLDEKRLKELSIGTFFYSALLLTEGTGLWIGKRWAEYFTILATSSFVPLELWELYKRFTAPRLTLLLLNLAIVAYLIFHLRWRRANEERKHQAAALAGPPARSLSSPASRPAASPAPGQTTESVSKML